jgi:uncharacterized protein
MSASASTPPTGSTAKPARAVPCPTCATPTPYRLDNPDRPFCSERCRLIDLGAWASGSFRLAVDAPPDPENDSPR